MEPPEDGSPEQEGVDSGSEEDPVGTWIYNQGRSCYSVALNLEDELWYSQQMASGTVLRGVLGPPSCGPEEHVEAASPDALPPWTWEAELSNQARIRLRREGPCMVSSYRKASAEGWTVPQRAEQQAVPEAERAARRTLRLRRLLLRTMIECGSNGRPLGSCRSCVQCAGWTRQELEPRRRARFARAAVASAAAACSSGLREARSRELHSLCDPPPSFNGVKFEFAKVAPEAQGQASGSGQPCGRCGCPEHAHEDVAKKFGRFLVKSSSTSITNIPLAALRWSQLEVALWGDTEGLFRPLAPAAATGKLTAASGEAGDAMVSVISPTTASRRCFHPFLWSCFHSQTYEPRQLIIIETCQDGPSPFFLEKARLDKRVIYKYYNVPPWQWSIGVKRNLACYFASGKIIAHFDDDDLYAPCYLEDMIRCLRDPKEAFALHQRANCGKILFQTMLASLGLSGEGQQLQQPGLEEECLHAVLGGFGAACAKLSSWYTFSLKKQGWSFFNVVGDDDDEPYHGDITCSLYGWGFSMVYLRAAWAVCPFLHMNLGEDFDLVRSLRQLGMPVVLVPDKRGMCAHTHHADNTAGGMDDDHYTTSSGLLYSPMGGMIQGYICATKLLQTAQEQQLEEGRSRRDAEGKLRSLERPGTGGAEKAAAQEGTSAPDPPEEGMQERKDAAEEQKVRSQRMRAAKAPRRPAPSAPAQRPPPGQFSVISSWDNWASKAEMTWDGCAFRYEGSLTTQGQKIQILSGGSREAALYPSVPDAGHNTAHVLKGPDNKGHGHYWLVPAASESRGQAEVFLYCPEGCPLGLGWAGTPTSLPEDRAGPWVPSGGCSTGRWQLRWKVGSGAQVGLVFLAEAGEERAAVTCPASVAELQYLAAMRGVPGVPQLLDYGDVPGGGAFHATPLLGDSLQAILARQDYDGLGGRLSWPAAQCLGRMLLSSLRGLHARGLVYCALAPGGMRVDGGSTQPFLTDFSLARPIGKDMPEGCGGACEFSSVRAGYSEERTPTDDLEALGWLMWRCVVGRLPWSGLAESILSKSLHERQRLSERVSKAKREIFRSGFSIFGPRFAHCPPALEAYLRTARGLTDLGGGIKATKYGELAKLLEDPEGQKQWAEAVGGKQQERYAVVKGRVLWRPLGSCRSAEAEMVESEAPFVVTVSGRSELLDGGRWAEVNPVWARGLPNTLLERRGWVLVADWAGQVLEPVAGDGSGPAAALLGAGPEAEVDVLSAVLGALRPAALSGAEEEAAHTEGEVEEQDDVEREQEVLEIAASAARQYKKAMQQ